MSQLEQNKKSAIAFYDMAFTACRPREAVEKFVGAEYIQHNPGVADGKEAFIAYFEKMAAEYPGKRIEFLRAVAEDDLVALHTHQWWPGGDEYVTMDFFRFDADGKIVEHWDSLQLVPEEMAHNNGMF